MAVKLHRCGNIWVKIEGHPCWRVQKALDETGTPYEVVKHKFLGDRADMVQLSGQKKFPVIQFEDGSVYREESKDMAATIRAGNLEQKRQGAQGSPDVSQPTST
jgi:glutaredoxin